MQPRNRLAEAWCGPGRRFASCVGAIAVAIIASACDRSLPAPASAVGSECREFEGTWTAAGNRQSVALGVERKASVSPLKDSLLPAGSRPDDRTGRRLGGLLDFLCRDEPRRFFRAVGDRDVGSSGGNLRREALHVRQPVVPGARIARLAPCGRITVEPAVDVAVRDRWARASRRAIQSASIRRKRGAHRKDAGDGPASLLARSPPS